MSWQLEEAVRKEDVPRTESCYQETTGILQEVMAQMEARDYRAPLSYPIVSYPKWGNGSNGMNGNVISAAKFEWIES